MRENLRQARRDKDMTQQDMADELGITLRHYQKIEYANLKLGLSLRAIQKYEGGEREPNLSLLVEMADFFDVPTSRSAANYIIAETKHLFGTCRFASTASTFASIT